MHPYLDGNLTTNGLPLTAVLGSNALAAGFRIGSDANGQNQVHAEIDVLESFDYPIAPFEVGFAFLDWPQAAAWTPPSGQQMMMGQGMFSMQDMNWPIATDVYPSNALWLQITAMTAVTNNSIPDTLITLNINGTLADVQYEVFSKQNLTDTQWVSEAVVFGSEDTNFTQATFLMGDRTNSLFMRVMSWIDSTGIGIPDWWQLEYFGYVGIDPYGDPAGDGWNNLQKYQNGMNPTNFYTPPTPQLSVSFNVSNSMATVSWTPASGPVAGYTVTSYDWQTGQSTNFTFNSSVNGFTENLSADAPYDPTDDGPTLYVSYQIQAHYAGGDSALSGDVLLEDGGIGSLGAANLVRGPQGSFYLISSGLPAAAATLQLMRVGPFDGSQSPTANFYIPVVTLTNGMYQLPASWLPLVWTGNESYGWWLQVMDATGNLITDPTPVGDNWMRPIPFFDGRQHLKDNLRFLLRAANASQPFNYTSIGEYPGNLNQPYSWPTDYAYSGLYYTDGGVSYAPLDEYKPFEQNYAFGNFALNTTYLDAYGGLTTGVSQHDQWFDIGLFLNYPPLYQFQAQTAVDPIPDIVTTNMTQWTYFYPLSAWPNYSYGDPNYDPMSIGITNTGPSWVMAGNVYNLFGLQYETVALTWGNDPSQMTTLGSPGSTAIQDGYFYSQTAQPQFQNVGYYFAQPGLDPLPGHAEFSATNAPPLLIASVGQPYKYRIAGYAKLSLPNGYSNIFAYLGQYFDQAYQIAANGIATTNTTGILSPYGEFFPTVPGPAALVTMPDIETGQRGTGVVSVISLNVDRNHDGTMDVTFTGQDQTSQAMPMEFWVNNDHDVPGTGGNPDKTIWLPPNATNLTDYSAGQIGTMRNLENFTRLWICGMPTLPASQGYSVQIGWSQIDSGAPKLRLYQATETNGGIGYLTNITTASQQIIDYNSPIGEVTPTSSLTLPTSWFTNGLNRYFLFEAGAVGKGALTLTISQGSNVIAQTSAWMDFHNIGDFYEEAAITNVIQTWPEMVQTNLDSGFTIVSYPTASIGDAQQMAVFVHGWRMAYSDYEIFSQAMFKRLYWKGYQGKCATVRWPTRSSDTDTNGEDILTYNRSEHISFESGTGAALYLYNLRNRFTNYTISVCSHSQGGILMMEALKELAASSVSPVDNYVLMEAAVPAHCYDTTVTNLPALMNMEASIPTPNTYSNYAAGMRSALRGGNICNLFNPADYALVSGLNGTGFGSWENNEELLKPLVFFGYIYIATNQTAYVITNQYTVAFGITNLQNRIVTDPLELMPFVARPHSKAVGAQAGVGNVVNGPEYNLQSQLGFTAASYDHSGQFNRNIQTPQVQGFYSRLVQNLFPPAP